MLNIVLHEPEIPANTGNIGRIFVRQNVIRARIADVLDLFCAGWHNKGIENRIFSLVVFYIVWN